MKKPCFCLWRLVLGLTAGCGYRGALQQIPGTPPPHPAEQFSAMTE